MGRKNQYDLINQLAKDGRKAEEIIEKTGISKSTVYQHLKKIHGENQYRLKQMIHNGEFVDRFFGTMDSFTDTVTQCNEQYQDIDATCNTLKDMVKEYMDQVQMPKGALALSGFINTLLAIEEFRVNTKFKAIMQRDAANHKKAELYNKVGVVAAMDEFIRKNVPMPINRPAITLSDEYIDRIPDGALKDRPIEVVPNVQ